MPKDATYWIQHLALQPHPEGGYYRQTYQAGLLIPQDALPRAFSGPRPASTAIYFLLQKSDFSAFHRLQSDELWHFYAGTTLLLHVIDTHGHYSEILLGPDPETGERFQAIVKAGCWFASQVRDASSYSLVACTVAPGFDFEDFELARREDLTRKYPQHRELIQNLTRI